MNLGHLFSELKRRNVYKVAVAYVVAGWALAQGLAQVLPVFNVPNWIIQLLVMLIVIGLPVALGLAWAFELTPGGIKRTDQADETNAARVHKKRAWLYVVIIGTFVSIGLFFSAAIRLSLYKAQRRIFQQSRSPFCRLKI